MKTALKKTLLAAWCALLLAGCAISPDDFETDAAYQAAVAERQAKLEKAGRISEGIRTAYVLQVEGFRAAGIDLAVLTPREQMIASTACATLTALGTVVSTDAVQLSDEGLAWCSELVKLLGRNVPDLTPEPVAVAAPPPDLAPI